MHGKVKYWNDEKYFGFILGEDNSDYFIHTSKIAQKGVKVLKVGQPVLFDASSSLKGLQALNLLIE